ncbi:hypothetical protein K1719_032942 [Acacia pycnantha]|nr:hypothetical protein K1719_032942 [Acacia pycnantha]
MKISSKIHAKRPKGFEEEDYTTRGSGGYAEESLRYSDESANRTKTHSCEGDRSKSLLFEACRLFKELDKLPNEDKKWEIISCVWVELLSYAACHCRPTGHVQLLSKGGELISFVWLLMVQLGLSTQFQIKDGDARAKLIVGKLLYQSTCLHFDIFNKVPRA